MKKIIAATLLLIMMFTICACGNNDTPDNTPAPNDNGATGSTPVQQPQGETDAGAMVLTKMGTAPDSVHFSSGGILTNYDKDSEKSQILNQNGVAFNDKWYDDIYSIISNGVCVVCDEKLGDKKLYGVVDAINQKELVPCEADEVAKLSDRFLFLGYTTLGVETSGKILDLATGQIVSGIEVPASQYDVSAMGNVIFIEKDSRTQDVYTADGQLIGSYELVYAYPESGIALQFTAEGVCVYDQDMKLVSTLLTADISDTYKPVDGTSEMLIHEYLKDGTRYNCVTDLSGKSLTAEYERILTVYPEGYLYITENEVSSIVDFAGNTIVSDFNIVQYRAPGYFIAQVQGGYFAYDATGKKINQTAMDSNDGLIMKDASGKVLIFSTGEVLDVEGYVNAQTGSLVLIDSTLYDVISGEAVLTEVDGCVATGNNLYVLDRESQTFTRYIAEFKPAD